LWARLEPVRLRLSLRAQQVAKREQLPLVPLAQPEV
jgi:hypothetical protein